MNGQLQHLIVSLTRELWNTQDLAAALAAAFGVRERDVGYAGLKDRHARVTQSFTILMQGKHDAKETPLVFERFRRIIEQIDSDSFLVVNSMHWFKSKLRLVQVRNDYQKPQDISIATKSGKGSCGAIGL